MIKGARKPVDCYRKDTEPLYHSFVYSLVSLLSSIYPLPAMHSLLVTFVAIARLMQEPCCQIGIWIWNNILTNMPNFEKRKMAESVEKSILTSFCV